MKQGVFDPSVIQIKSLSLLWNNGVWSKCYINCKPCQNGGSLIPNFPSQIHLHYPDLVDYKQRFVGLNNMITWVIQFHNLFPNEWRSNKMLRYGIFLHTCLRCVFWHCVTMQGHLCAVIPSNTLGLVSSYFCPCFWLSKPPIKTKLKWKMTHWKNRDLRNVFISRLKSIHKREF